LAGAFAAAGFTGADLAAGFAAVFAFGAAAALAGFGASLAAAGLAFAFAGAVVFAAFATCLSLSPSIWALASKKRPPRRSRIPRGNPALHLCIASIGGGASLAPAAVQGKICRRNPAVRPPSGGVRGQRQTSASAVSRMHFEMRQINKKMQSLTMS
jgi:hypothetical protein